MTINELLTKQSADASPEEKETPRRLKRAYVLLTAIKVLELFRELFNWLFEE